MYIFSSFYYFGLRKCTWIFYDGTVKKISVHTAPSALLAVRYLGCRVAPRQAIRSDGQDSIGTGAFMSSWAWKKRGRRRGYTRPAALTKVRLTDLRERSRAHSSDRRLRNTVARRARRSPAIAA